MSLAGLVSKAFAGSVTTQLIGAAAGILGARLLGPQGKGLLVIALLWPGLLGALGGGLGLEEAVTYLTARTPERSGALMSSATVLAAGQALLLTTVGWLLLPPLLGNQGAGMLGDARLYLAWVALSYLTLTAMATLQGALRFGALNLLRPVVVAGTLIGLVLLVLDNRVSVHAVVVVYLAANGLALCLAWALAIRAVRPGWPHPRLFKPLLSFAARAQLGHVATVANERVDVALLSILVPAAQVGLYAAALGVAAALRLFGSSFALVALPALASEHHRPATLDTVGRLCRTTAWSSAAAGIVAVLAMPVLIPLLFGGAFAAAVRPGQILVAAVVTLNMVRVLSASLKGLGLPAQASLGDAIGAALTVALLLALVPTLGLTGAALAAVLSYLASLGYLIWIVRGRLAVPPLALLVGRGSVPA